MMAPVLDTAAALWGWLVAPAVVVADVPTTRLEIVAFVSGAACVWLVARQHVLNWPIGILNSAAFLLLFATSGLFADASLQVVYIALGFYGWWQWVYGGPTRNDLPVSRTSARQWTALGAATAGATMVVWWVLVTFSSSAVPGPDSVTTTLSLAATWGQCVKKVESWWLWIAADVIYIPLYAYKGLWLTAALYLVFLALCVFGLRAWRGDLGTARGMTLSPAAGV
jgi:nicotinamide mononucleotide transporter